MTNNKTFNRLYNLRIIVKHDYQCGLISKKTLEHQLKRLNNLLSIYI